MDTIASKLAMVGLLGIACQWLAWRFKLPAITLLLAAGFIVGPLTGYLDPAQDLGKNYKSIVGLAVAIILFEGGLTLKWNQIKDSSTAFKRVIMFGGPMVWLGAALSAYFIGGLEWPTAIILGAILVVTGPTVIMPLLRSARLAPRSSAMLRWEAIVNDPIGAMFAVLAFEAYLVFFAYTGDHSSTGFVLAAIFALLAAGIGGWAIGRFIIFTFQRGNIPEFLKAPVLFVSVLVAFVSANLLLEEAGLLTVTVMGMVIGNSRLASLNEMRRFKETITILLVSGVFILLTAALKMETLEALDFRALGFVFAVLFVVRPIAIMLATKGTELNFNERILISWIAPRGIVAVAVSGLFGATLVETGVADGDKMIAYTFAVVAATILLHGFTLPILARLLGLQSSEKLGILLVGASDWGVEFAAKLKEHDVPVLLADRNWARIQNARMAGLEVYYGEVLSEAAHHDIDLNRFNFLIAASDNDYRNALICSDFGPEMGRQNVFQASNNTEAERQRPNFTIGGRPLCEPNLSAVQLRAKQHQGWSIKATSLSDAFTWQDYQAEKHADAIVILWIDSDDKIIFANASTTKRDVPKGSTVISFTPSKTTQKSKK